MTKIYRVLILSDLHAIRDDARLRTTASMNYAQIGAARGLLMLTVAAVEEKFPDGIDLVLVAGDMTDKASGGPLADVWADLQWLAEQLGAPLVATAGNHDYDSRASQDPLPTKSLMGLTPPFPFGAEEDRNKYFSEQHAVYSDERAVVVTANSAAFHGYVVDGAPEHDHGRYSTLLPELLERSLAKIVPRRPINIFLTHHHLNQLPEFDDEERSFSIGHENVVRTLLSHGNWLIVHGHKHRGWIQYASGPGDSPTLLSSSSYSADFEGGTFAEKVRHQFHVVEISSGEVAVDGVAGIYGAVHSWTHSQIGWREARHDEDLPGYSGFGWKVNIFALADRFMAALEIEGSLSEEEIEAMEPRIRFLTFDDQRRLIRVLATRDPEIICNVSDQGRIQEMSIARRII